MFGRKRIYDLELKVWNIGIDNKMNSDRINGLEEAFDMLLKELGYTYEIDEDGQGKLQKTRKSRKKTKKSS
jgi:hypothetical protein